MHPFNIFMTGVGGQGIGLLSEILLRAADHAGHTVKAVDTHGLAQRGGIVVSQLRIGTSVHTPLISLHQADLVVAMERHEALRALQTHAKAGGTLIYYNTVWQPLDVRLNKAPEVTTADLEARCKMHQVHLMAVYDPALEDVHMQNVVLLAHMDQYGLVPGVTTGHYRQAMQDLMTGGMLNTNMALFESQRSVAIGASV
jgi:indolepyruvate ferredoxin oxidoreductase, beta subunit